MRRLLVFGLFLAAGCGSSSSPAAPDNAQVAGVWGGSIQQTSASGGPECLLLFLGSNGSSDQNSLQINQSGTALTAAQTSLSTGAACQLTGTSSTSSITLNATGCSPNKFSAVCSNNNRDAYLVSRAITANINGNLMNGSVSDRWNIYAGGDTTTILGTIVVTSSLVMSR